MLLGTIPLGKGAVPDSDVPELVKFGYIAFRTVSRNSGAGRGARARIFFVICQSAAGRLYNPHPGGSSGPILTFAIHLGTFVMRMLESKDY